MTSQQIIEVIVTLGAVSMLKLLLVTVLFVFAGDTIVEIIKAIRGNQEDEEE